MGLAASQARFLAITSRKNSLEFKSMQIAQEKLSCTRELEKASQEYQEALNVTKMIWDPDGTGETPFELSYNLLMYPSEVNDYVPWMISRRDGRIALNPTMARAAKMAGIPEEGTNNPTAEMYDAFLTAMVATGGMSEVSARYCRDIGWQPTLGIGGVLMDKTKTSEMTITNVINYIDLAAGKINNGTDAERQLAQQLTFTVPRYDSSLDESVTNPHFKESLSQKSSYLNINGNRVSNENGDVTFNLADLLNEDVTLAFTTQKNSSWWKKVLAAVGSVLTGTVLFGGYNSLKDMLGYQQAGKCKYPDDVPKEDQIVFEMVDQMISGFAAILDVRDSEIDAQAFNYAIQETLGLLADSKDLGTRNHSNDAYNDAIKESNNYNGWVKKGASKGGNFGTNAISLSTLAESFLTFYAQGVEGYTGKYYIRQDGKKSSYVTDDFGYYYKIKQDGDDALTTESIYRSEFYSALFNNLCQNGWYENIYIDDEDYLANGLKNAQLFVTSMNQDGYYYQDRYNAGEYIMEVTDEDAVTQAEMEFTQKKSKINYKEEQLEIDMKKLDLEISSLTTEYDTVKNLITKNVEKTFTMFQS